MIRIVLDDAAHGDRGENLVHGDGLGIHLLLRMLRHAEGLSGGKRLQRLEHALIGHTLL